MVSRLNRKRAAKEAKEAKGKKAKEVAKAWKEWHHDFVAEADSDQMAMLTHSLAKFRQEDKIALKRATRLCNTGGHHPAPMTFGTVSENKQS